MQREDQEQQHGHQQNAASQHCASRQGSVMMPGQFAAEDEIDLRELWNTLWAHKWFIVLFSALVTAGAVLYALSQPNTYASKSVLVPAESAKPQISGGLASLAGFAGVDLGGGGIGVSDHLQIIKDDYEFMRQLALENQIYQRLRDPRIAQEMHFGFGIRAVYDLFSAPDPEDRQPWEQLSPDEREVALFETVRTLREQISISTDKQSGAISIQAQHPSPRMARELVQLFLDESTRYLRQVEMQDIEKKIQYYNQEIRRATEVSLKDQLSTLVTTLIQKKVLSQASPYYNLRQVTRAIEPHPKDKAGPKRALMVVVAAVTGGMLAVFLVFVREFVRGDTGSSEIPN